MSPFLSPGGDIMIDCKDRCWLILSCVRTGVGEMNFKSILTAALVALLGGSAFAGDLCGCQCRLRLGEPEPARLDSSAVWAKQRFQHQRGYVWRNRGRPGSSQ